MEVKVDRRTCRTLIPYGYMAELSRPGLNFHPDLFDVIMEVTSDEWCTTGCGLKYIGKTLMFKNNVIGIQVGEADTREECARKHPSLSTYMDAVDNFDLIFDSCQKGSLGRFIKHSKTPNVSLEMTYVKAPDDRIYQVPVFYALEDIATGTIVTRDYGGSYIRSMPGFAS
ncbi:hypothetical protein CYMTET_52683 [Cymbomonas tetramitiformis]|uniref:SET domain-containing protein n=1 Tax=Cymbomonas tetramitiformis TaxID=36881 RepID=A0AAE0BJN7_9CHLO|nr:hypothetical protein CYMTET_52683 [Cymbomonas tetramitiformis]